MITALGYIGIRATKPEEWPDFAGKFLGMQQVDSGGGTSLFRMDDRAQRLIVTPEASDGLHFMGWEVDDFAATFAERAFCRPLDAQVQALVADPFVAAPDVDAALERSLLLILSSPLREMRVDMR